jgi:pimeloyl-ACP methyl ester carboxylesterase
MKTTAAALAFVLLLGLFAVYIVFFAMRDRTPTLPGEHSIAVLEEIDLGGVPQSVLIRGHDTRNPMLLFLHGGPGMPAMFLAHDFQRELERDFTMVHWDRRGAGKSFAYDGEQRVSQIVADTLELAALLIRRFGKTRVYLAGHSWGSYLGMLAVRENPSLFHAFIGIGQIAGSRDEVRAERQGFAGISEGDLTEDELFRLGGELYEETSFWPILRTGLCAPEYDFLDALNVGRGASRVGQRMQYDMGPAPQEGEVGSLEVPVFFFLGRFDYNTPSRLAAAYLERLRSPLKETVWFEESAHFPFWEQPDAFHRALLRVRQMVEEFEGL